MNTIIDKAQKYLHETYKPQMIILYGSFVSETSNILSDIDIICFCDLENPVQDSTEISGFFLDAWIYPLAHMIKTRDFIHIMPCLCLYDELSLFDRFTKEILDLRYICQKPLPLSEKRQIDLWIDKMIRRSTLDDEEGNYRYNWLLHDFPELYCKYINLFFDGPKKTIQFLKANDYFIFNVYSNLLCNKKDVKKLSELYKALQIRFVSQEALD